MVGWLREQGHEPVDHGPFQFDPLDDYPVFCLRAAEAVVADEGSLGVVIGGSGNGEQIAANKVRGVRAALAWSDDTASLARQHNDANVISIGGRMHSLEEMTRFIAIFLTRLTSRARNGMRAGSRCSRTTRRRGSFRPCRSRPSGHGPKSSSDA